MTASKKPVSLLVFLLICLLLAACSAETPTPQTLQIQPPGGIATLAVLPTARPLDAAGLVSWHCKILKSGEKPVCGSLQVIDPTREGALAFYEKLAGNDYRLSMEDYLRLVKILGNSPLTKKPGSSLETVCPGKGMDTLFQCQAAQFGGKACYLELKENHYTAACDTPVVFIPLEGTAGLDGTLISNNSTPGTFLHPQNKFSISISDTTFRQALEQVANIH